VLTAYVSVYVELDRRSVLIIKHPSQVLLQYLANSYPVEKPDQYRVGFLAMALEIITHMRLLEILPVVDGQARQEALTAFQTLLHDTGIEADAEDWYERLITWRRPSFLREPSLGQLETSDAVHYAGSPLSRPPAVASSRLASLVGEVAQSDTLPEEQPERQSLDEETHDTSSSRWGSAFYRSWNHARRVM
jgi:hypothetical protein